MEDQDIIQNPEQMTIYDLPNPEQISIEDLQQD